jgi:predicted ATPase
VFLNGAARAETSEPVGGLQDMHRGVQLLRDQKIVTFDGLIKIALAQAEARAGGVDRAVAFLVEALATSERIGSRTFDAELHRVRGEMILKRDPANPALAEEAFQTAVAVAKQQGTRSFGLRASLSLAKLYQSTGRSNDAHAVLAPALEGFSPMPEMPEIAEAQALLAALAEIDEVKSSAVARQRRLHLQTSYSKALMLSRGFASEEAKAAFDQTQELARGVDKAAERFEAYWGLFIGSVLRGELRLARETAEIFLREAEKEERTTEAAAARRNLGLACLYQGDLAVARAHFEHALRIFDPERDREAKFGFGTDTGAAATLYLALTKWLVGEPGPAGKLAEEAIARAIESAHAPTLAIAYWFKAMFDAFRDDAEAARRAADSALEVSRAHGLGFYLVAGALFSSWARARLGDRVTGMTELRQALAAYADQGNKVIAPFFQGQLAELEAEGQDYGGALARIHGAVALAEQTGEHWTDALLHRIRGDILLKADPGNPARAEEAYLAAIAIAREQGARCFGLRAALSLAKLYQSTGRPADAHAVLAPALEGFSPTPEMPEIAEAQPLLAALAEMNEVKTAEAQRQRRAQLHVAYGNALIAARGHGARDTTAAFARARESAVGDKDTPERLAADYGLWVGSLVRGELAPMRAHVETFLGDVEARPNSPEACVAQRAAGMTHWFAGEYVEARDHLERALALFKAGRDDDLAFRFGQDAGVTAIMCLAFALWPLGDVERAVSLVGDSETRCATLADIGTRAFGITFTAMFALMRGDTSRAAANAAELTRLMRGHDLAEWRVRALFLEGLATIENGEASGGLEALHRGSDLLREQKLLLYDGLVKIALAEAEARAGDVDRGLTTLEEALATSNRIGHRAFDAELHRVRGEMLLKRDPANPAPAEESLLTAIGVAKQQRTRSFKLRASLSLAELYQSTGRPVEAHAVLAPALEGFAPTTEMPEIAKAQALMERLG